MRSAFQVLVAVATMLLAEPCAAQETDTRDAEARANFEAGRLAFADARFGDALLYFERSYALSGRPELLYNIGICHDRLGHDADALRALEGYLEALPDAANRAEVEQRIATARARVERAAAPLPTSVDPTGWILFGTGAAVLVAGGVLLGVGVGERASVVDSMGLEWTDAMNRLSTAEIIATTGGVALGVGAVLATIGLILQLGTSGPSETNHARLTPHGLELTW